MKAVIMAGGVGKRLRPLTCDCPKPMVPMMNRPVMAYSVELLKRHGVEDIAVTLQYLPDRVMDYFGDGSGFGVRMHYFIEEKPLGTAGSVRQATNLLDETFVVISGDALTDIDLTEALRFHREKRSLCTIVLKKVDVPIEYGIVLLKQDGRIQRFYEKPDWDEIYSDLANTGIYIMEPEALSLIAKDEFSDFAKNLFPKLLSDGAAIYGCVTKGYWCDIGDLAQYLQAHRDILDGRCKVKLHAQRVGESYIENGALVDQSAVIQGPCYIGARAWVGPRVAVEPYSVLGGGVKLEREASVKRSVIWEGATLRRSAQVRGAVLCDNVTLKDGASVFEEAVVGKASIVGESCVIKPKVCVWPGKNIEAHVTLSEDCVWNSGAKRRLFEEGAVVGSVDCELTPTMAARLGAAFAASLPEFERSVGIGSDGDTASVAIKQGLISGLLAYGADVYDMERMTMPMLRFGVEALSLSGGVLVNKAGRLSKVAVRMLEADGSELGSILQRKVQAAFEHLDERPSSPDMLGLIYMRRDIFPFYRAKLLKLADRGAMREHSKTVLIKAEPAVADFMVELFSRLGWRAFVSGSREALFGGEVLTRQADVGFCVSESAEGLTVYDETGKIVSGEAKNALLIYSHLYSNTENRLVLPIGTPEPVVNWIMGLGVEVELAKSEKAGLRRAMAKRNPLLALKWFDAVAGALSVSGCMARSGMSVGAMLKKLPEFHLHAQNVACSWRDVGRVLRTLVELNPKENTECIEGVRIRHENGWALVRPNRPNTGFNVLCEGFSEEYADSLTDLYVKKVQAIKKENDLK